MEAAQAIDWDRPPTAALNADNAPMYEWFTDARVNTCWNAVDRHVEAGHGEQARDHPRQPDHRDVVNDDL